MGIEMKPLLDAVVAKRAGDLYLEVGKPPTLRVRGILEPIGSQNLTAADTTRLMAAIVSDELRRKVDAQGCVEFGFCYSPAATPTYFLVTAFKQGSQPGLVLRALFSDPAASPGSCPVCGGKMNRK